METKRQNNYKLMRASVERFSARIKDAKLKEMFNKCFYNTLDTTVEYWDDGSTFVITGDIEAMWLRDSSAQVMQYLEFADDPDVRALIKGLIKRQLAYLQNDPYANAFCKAEKGNFDGDECEKHPHVWERKFELDSLCYPLWLAVKYYKNTGDIAVFNGEFYAALSVILHVFETEQKHNELSDYYHYRPTDPPELSVPNHGRGNECAPCGLVWSGYRPSDDACVHGYFIPGNAFISVVFAELLAVKDKLSFTDEQIEKMANIKRAVDKAIDTIAVYSHEKYGEIYAYELDGLGNYNLMDDANVPSLLSLPYLGYCSLSDEKYVNTRKFVLSKDNPYYYTGECITGVGSPHTPANQVWPISLIMRALTSDDEKEINEMVDMLMQSDAGTYLMHESVDKDDCTRYTRSWFAWANSLFSLMLIRKADKIKYIV